MYWHCTLQLRIRLPGGGDIEDAVDRLVAAGAENGGAEDLVCLGIDGDLHKALRLALFDCAADARHRALGAEQFAASGSRLCFGHAEAAQRRINIERITERPVAAPPLLAVQQV